MTSPGETWPILNVPGHCGDCALQCALRSQFDEAAESIGDAIGSIAQTEMGGDVARFRDGVMEQLSPDHPDAPAEAARSAGRLRKSIGYMVEQQRATVEESDTLSADCPGAFTVVAVHEGVEYTITMCGSPAQEMSEFHEGHTDAHVERRPLPPQGDAS